MTRDAFLADPPSEEARERGVGRVGRVRDLVQVGALAIETWIQRLSKGASSLPNPVFDPETDEPLNHAAKLFAYIELTIAEHLKPAVTFLNAARDETQSPSVEANTDEEATDPVGPIQA